MSATLTSFLAALFPTTLTPATLAGVLALGACCAWPLLESRRHILAVQVLSSILYAAHYGLLGATTAAAMCLAGATQGVLARSIADPRRRALAVGATVVVCLGVTALTWQGLPSLLAQCGQILSAVGRLRRRPQSIRLSFLGSEAFWTTHNALVGSFWGLMGDTLSVTAILIGLWRGWRHWRAAVAHFPRLLGRRAVPAE